MIGAMRPCVLGDSTHAFSGRSSADRLPGRCIPKSHVSLRALPLGSLPSSPQTPPVPSLGGGMGLYPKSLSRAGAQQQQQQRGSAPRAGARGNLMSGQEEPPLLKLACKLAAEKGLEEISVNEVSKVVSFRASPSLGAKWSGRANVYYTTFKVGISAKNHAQVIHTNVTEKELDKLFTDPLSAEEEVPPFLKVARDLAAEKGLKEIMHNEVSKVVSFRALPSSSGSVNVYYTTRNAGICAIHHAQVFHNSVTEKELDKLFADLLLAEEQVHPFLKVAREIADRAGLEETMYNEKSRVVSFSASPSQGAKSPKWSGRMNVYYTTRSVGTCIHHPKKGKAQLYRLNVDEKELFKLMTNPRKHTGRGYYK
eukprot:gene26157-11883_t